MTIRLTFRQGAPDLHQAGRDAVVMGKRPWLLLVVLLLAQQANCGATGVSAGSPESRLLVAALRRDLALWSDTAPAVLGGARAVLHTLNPNSKAMDLALSSAGVDGTGTKLWMAALLVQRFLVTPEGRPLSKFSRT